MKVKIITIHDPDVNYGSTLQSCGTYNFIKNLGYDVEIINYRPNYKTIRTRIKKTFTNLLFLLPYIKRRTKINNYFKYNAKLTCKYKSYKKLCENIPCADVYLTGSDVIWNRDVNPEGNDPAFYLGFVKKGYRMSYAPSMGEIQSNENLMFIKNQIKDFDFITVREEESKEQLESVGLLNVSSVVDPVFLLERDYYDSKVSKNKYGEYSLVYLMSYNEEKKALVKTITNSYKSRVVSFGGFKKKCECEVFIRDAGVEDFLTLISNAKHVITDSFHCIAFCLIFNKQFVYLPSIDSSMRIENILEIAGLSDRIVKNKEDFFSLNSEIDYMKVNERVQNKVLYSRNYLKTDLETLERKLNETD